MEGDNMNNTNSSFASSYRGRNTAMSADDLRKARESRAADALKMKDEQIHLLNIQYDTLRASLDKLEEDANTLNLEKLAVEQENRSVRDSNFDLQSKARAAETISKRMQSEVVDKDQQIRIMTDQNSELVRLLESEEVASSQLQSEVSELRAELDELRQKYSALLITAKTHEEVATKSAKEGQLRAEEIRLLRVETEQLKQQNTELKMKTQVEVEALQEQLRVRKEKQYQLLEKLQAQEEAKRQAEDQVAGMEEQLRGLHARNVDLEEQIKVQSRSKSNVDEANKELQLENGNLFAQNRELQSKIEKSERERSRMEAEARDSGEKLREMADKVFQLLEQLKLANLGKSKSMEALKKKELDMASLQKKNARLIKDTSDEAKARVKAELDVQTLQDQVRALKKNLAGLAQKSKEETALKIKSNEECEQLLEAKKSAEARIGFLFNKVQADEESRILQTEDRKKLEAQVLSYTERCEELQRKLTDMGESNRVITQAMRLKQEQLHEINAKYDNLLKESQSKGNKFDSFAGDDNEGDVTASRPGGGADDIDNVRLNEGRGRFYVEAKSAGGGSLLVLKARKPLYKDWLEKFGVNEFLKRAQKTTRFRDLVVEKFAAVYGLLMVEEEEKEQLNEQLSVRSSQIDILQKKTAYVQDTLAIEEDAKRRMLLRYIHAVKEHAMAVNEGTGGVLQLPESNITDEEIHALAALLRNNTSIEELNLRGNNITDDGARALGAVLAGRSGLRLVDLRGNKIGKGAIRVLAEALERSERVRHVYVHAGGKIEALGAQVIDEGNRWAVVRNADGTVNNSAADQSAAVGNNVSTVCVVDIRDNNPEQTSFPYELTQTAGGGDANAADSFKPIKMLDTIGNPRRGALNSSPPQKAKVKSKNVLSKSIVRSASFAANEGSVPLSETEKKKMKIKAHDDKLIALKESAWQGRSGGMDIDRNGENESLRESIRMKKKNLQRGELPPISDTAASVSPTLRGGSAPGFRSEVDDSQQWNTSMEGIMGAPPASTTKNDTKKTKKVSETERRLENSPFSQPVSGKIRNGAV